MSEASSLLAIDGAIATLTFNRPHVSNALSIAMVHLLLEQVRRVELDRTVRVLIINANGNAFCAGADLKEGLIGSAEDIVLQSFGPFITALRNLDKVVIAAVNGAVAGIGAAVVTAADLAVAAENSYMQIGFSKIGLVPDGGLTWDLVRSMGYKPAYRAMLEATKIRAPELLDYGIVNEVVADADLSSHVSAWAQRLAQLSPVAAKLTKRAMRRAMELTLEQTVMYEASQQERAAHSGDVKEGIAAFREKRQPKFPGV